MSFLQEAWDYWPQALRHGGIIILSAVVAAAVAAVVAFYATGLPRDAGAPGTKEINVVVTTGEQGYPVEAFCIDPLTTVTKGIAGPDSTYKETYDLDRVRDGVREKVEVGVYPDDAREPAATHYDSVNRSQSGFVSTEAMSCIRRKAK